MGPFAVRRWDSPPEQHPLEGHILEWVRRRLRESKAPAREAFDALPLPHRRVFAARRLEVEVAEAGFAGFLDGPYGVLAPDALEAMRAFGADEHAALLEKAMSSRGLWGAGRRRRALASATADFFTLDDRSPLMAQRAVYIGKESAAFSGLDGPGR